MGHKERMKTLKTQGEKIKDSFLSQKENGNPSLNIPDLSQTLYELNKLESEWESIKSGQTSSNDSFLNLEKSNRKSSFVDLSSESSERKKEPRQQTPLFDVSSKLENLKFGKHKSTSQKPSNLDNHFFSGSGRKKGDFFQYFFSLINFFQEKNWSCSIFNKKPIPKYVPCKRESD